MSIYRDKVVLIVGGLNIIDSSFVAGILDAGAREVRILGSSETAVQSLREELESTPRLRFFVGDMTDNTYLEEAMSGADYVLFVPETWNLKPETNRMVEEAPAETTITFLETVATVLHTATDCRVQKTVVVSPATQQPLVAMPDMLAALMDTVVVAEGRYLGKDSQTAIICARHDGDLIPLADFAFADAANVDLLVQTNEGISRIPCENFEMRRE